MKYDKSDHFDYIYKDENDKKCVALATLLLSFYIVLKSDKIINIFYNATFILDFHKRLLKR